MFRPARFVLILILWVTAAIAVLWLAIQPSSPARAAAVIPPLPTNTLSPTATPEFSATLSLSAAPQTLFVGETLTVTANLTVSEGCQYPLMELILKEDAVSTIFAYLEPPGDIIEYGVEMPSVWTFRALQPGTAEFTAQTFGERYCNDYWNWHYETARSSVVVILPGTYQSWLPTVAS